MTETPEKILERLLNGEAVDAAGGALPARDLTRMLYALSRAGNGPSTIALSNAALDGDILLDALGERGRPLALQLIGCTIKGVFRARSSHWRQLVIAQSSVRAIDVPRCRVIGEASFEDVRCTGWLEARGSEFLGALLLNGAAFKKGDRDRAIVLADSRVGLSVSAHRLDVEGGINASRMNVAGFVRFDGSRISGAEGCAVNLADAVIGAEVGFALSDGTPFRAKGAVIVASAKIGGIEMTAAQLDGERGPAFVADRAQISGAIDLSGADAQHRFQAKGCVRLIATQVKFQLQVVNADISVKGGLALSADSAEIDGDVLLGHEHGDFTALGDVTINNAKIGGRVLLSRARFSGRESAFALRQSAVRNEVAIYDCRATGAVRLDNTRAWGLTVKNLAVTRSLPHPDRDGLPDGYAHEMDTLFDFSATQLATDAHIESLSVEKGDCRLIGANVAGGVMVSNVRIEPTHAYAIIAQGASMGSFALSGVKRQPSPVRGDINLMGARIAGSATFVDVEAVGGHHSAAIHFKSARIEGDLQFHRVRVAGEINAIGAHVEGNLVVAGCVLGKPKAAAFDIRNARVQGDVSLEADDPHGERTMTRIEGNVFASGAHVGALRWKALQVGDCAAFFLTDVAIEGALEPGQLIQEGSGYIDLSGTHAGDLADTLDDMVDGWGAGRTQLAIDCFRYSRLRNPSGRGVQGPGDVRSWRKKWLSRRLDRRSGQAGRHLANILRQQGLHEAARLTLIDAFSSEVEQRPLILRALGRAFGLAFGHGLGGWNAFWTVVAVWVIGIITVADMQAHGLLVRTDAPIAQPAACGNLIDPLVYAADVMIPLLDLGQEKLCSVGPSPAFVASHAPRVFEFMGAHYAVGEWEAARFFWSLYALLGWVVVSLTIATWSGVFRRAGRE